MSAKHGGVPPILAQKHYKIPSAFTPESLLREARRQKQITGASIPPICVLDPDGDMVRHLLACGEAGLDPASRTSLLSGLRQSSSGESISGISSASPAS